MFIKKRTRSSVYYHFLSFDNWIDYYQSTEQIKYRNAYAIKKRGFFLMKSLLLSILWYFKALALSQSLNQGNREEKYRGKLGKRELLVFHSKPLRWWLFIKALALTTNPAVINECTHFKLRFLQNWELLFWFNYCIALLNKFTNCGREMRKPLFLLFPF